MAYLSQFTYDYFISYAVVDDETAAGVQTGWVTNLVRSVAVELERTIGGRGRLNSFWDRQDLARNQQLEEQIRNALQSTACFVLVLTEGYLGSPWCLRELQWFREAASRQARSNSRIFVVDQGNIPESIRRQQFDGHLTYPFFEQGVDGRPRILGYPEPDPKRHPGYYDAVTQLTREISFELKALRETLAGASPVAVLPLEATGGATTPGGPTTGASDKADAGSTLQPLTVFLAETSDDLLKQRRQVQQYLEDNQYRVLRVASPAATLADWQQQARPLLEQADAFVQLLGMFPGREFEDCASGLVQQQSQLADEVQQLRAQQHGTSDRLPLQILQWRSSTLLPQLADQPVLLELASAPRVIAGPLEEFKSEIKRTVVRPTPKPQPQNSRTQAEGESIAGDVMPVVFINAGAEDLPQAEQLLQQLSDLNCLPQTPLLEGTPEEIRREMDAGLLESDGLIYFYGRISPEWVRRQFRTLPTVIPRRAQQQPPRARPLVAICCGEPPGKPSPGVAFPGMKTIDLLSPAAGQQLRDWVQALRAGGAT